VFVFRNIFYTSIFLVLVSAVNVHAQINPYSRLTDPRAIARLDGPDSEPLRYSCYHGLPAPIDPVDSNHILAQDSGAGIITHIWMTTDAPDSMTSIKIYIDDKLVVSSTFFSFYEKAHGLLRPSFDSLYPGGYVCDVQMPYKKGFRITYQGTWNIYFAIAWRPVYDPASIAAFDTSSALLEGPQAAAERIITEGHPNWENYSISLVAKNETLTPHGETTLADIAGPAFIRKIQFRGTSNELPNYDSLLLKIYWDGSPYPAVNVPLADFFCMATGFVPISAFHLSVSSGTGLQCFFPMPFASHARIVLVNTSSKPFPFISFVGYGKENVDRHSYGYFHAQFSESNPTRFHVMHPALNERGRGRFIGLYLAIPNCPSGVALEGDPIFTIDSLERNHIHYTGGEDYYNGGWWFFGKTFSRPFAGHPKFFETFYRFHLLDAIDFKSSIDFDMQPGARTDVTDHYRTIAYYYKLWTPFWTNRDTIRTGEMWHIGGNGYVSGEHITLRLDENTIAETQANDSGAFNLDIRVAAGWGTGVKKLSVNGETRPRPITLLKTAIVYPRVDFLPPELRSGDTLIVEGKGFIPGEKIDVYFDSIRVSANDLFKANEDYSIRVIAKAPYIADRKYQLSVRGEFSGKVLCAAPVVITRVLKKEFEDLVPSTTWKGDSLFAENLSYRWFADWSKQAMASFYAGSSGDSVRFRFTIPANDTFDVRLFLTKGWQYGRYSYSLDDKKFGTFEGYSPPRPYLFELYPSDTIKLGTLALRAGEHSFSFVCEGKADSALAMFLGADLLLLTPTTTLPISPGTILDTGIQTVTNLPNGDAIAQTFIYPNPASSQSTTIGMRIMRDSDINFSSFDITIFDPSGREILQKYNNRFEYLTARIDLDISKFLQGDYYVVFTLRTPKETRRYSQLLTVVR
jgi:hypothetical protein